MWEIEIRRIAVPGQSRQKSSRDFLNRKKLGVVVHTCQSCYDLKYKNDRIAVQAGLGKEQDPISEVIRIERAGGIAQTVSKHLPI
jgi:hypothetical protein